MHILPLQDQAQPTSCSRWVMLLATWAKLKKLVIVPIGAPQTWLYGRFLQSTQQMQFRARTWTVDDGKDWPCGHERACPLHQQVLMVLKDPSMDMYHGKNAHGMAISGSLDLYNIALELMFPQLSSIPGRPTALH